MPVAVPSAPVRRKSKALLLANGADFEGFA